MPNAGERRGSGRTEGQEERGWRPGPVPRTAGDAGVPLCGQRLVEHVLEVQRRGHAEAIGRPKKNINVKTIGKDLKGCLDSVLSVLLQRVALQ